MTLNFGSSGCTTAPGFCSARDRTQALVHARKESYQLDKLVSCGPGMELRLDGGKASTLPLTGTSNPSLLVKFPGAILQHQLSCKSVPWPLLSAGTHAPKARVQPGRNQITQRDPVQVHLPRSSSNKTHIHAPQPWTHLGRAPVGEGHVTFRLRAGSRCLNTRSQMSRVPSILVVKKTAGLTGLQAPSER